MPAKSFKMMIAHAHNVYLIFGGVGPDNARTEENIICKVRSQLKSPCKESEVEWFDLQ